MTRLQFDNKISLGHLLTAGAMILGGTVAYADLRSSQAYLTEQLTQRRAEIVAVEAAATARESRLRAVELLQAGQVSDLRNIQSGITRIEAQLDRLARERNQP